MDLSKKPPTFDARGVRIWPQAIHLTQDQVDQILEAVSQNLRSFNPESSEQLEQARQILTEFWAKFQSG